jgi:acetylornithine aminotransferase
MNVSYYCFDDVVLGHRLDADQKRWKVISFRGGFHGRTMGALSATANMKYQEPFTPLVPGFKYADLNNIQSVEEVRHQTMLFSNYIF